MGRGLRRRRPAAARRPERDPDEGAMGGGAAPAPPQPGPGPIRWPVIIGHRHGEARAAVPSLCADWTQAGPGLGRVECNVSGLKTAYLRVA